MAGTGPPGPAAAAAPARKRNLVPMAVGGAVALVLIVGGVFWWIDKQKHETTDNAFVQADTVQVSPQIAGAVADVLVDDNQPVQAGQILVRLDPAPIQARLDQAMANAAALQAGVAAVDDRASEQQATVAQRAAAVASAQAAAQMSRADMDRYRSLQTQGWVAPQRVETQRAAVDQAAAAVAQAQASLEQERRGATGMGSQRSQALAQARAAQASVEQARIDLDRATIRAPIAGVVGARAVRQGQQVAPGAALMTIVPLARTYIVANFKETQVARLRIGQPVTIHADAFGNREIRGRVASFAPATGSQFALIPVENAVGNFTKVTQRVPVKIALEPGGLSGALRPGLSVHVDVDVTVNSGPSFAEAAAAAGPAPPATIAAAPPASLRR